MINYFLSLKLDYLKTKLSKIVTQDKKNIFVIY